MTARAIDLAIDVDLALARALVRASDRTSDRAIAIDLALASNRASSLAIARASDRASDRAIASDFAFSLTLVRDLVSTLATAIMLGHTSTRDLAIVFFLATAIAIAFAFARVLNFSNGFVMGFLSPVCKSKNKNNDIKDHDSTSWIYFLLDEEYRQHLNDLRQHWNYKTRNLCLLQRRWIIWSETRVFEIQTIWAMGVMKLEEILGMYRLP